MYFYRPKGFMDTVHTVHFALVARSINLRSSPSNIKEVCQIEALSLLRSRYSSHKHNFHKSGGDQNTVIWVSNFTVSYRKKPTIHSVSKWLSPACLSTLRIEIQVLHSAAGHTDCSLHRGAIQPFFRSG